jgi:hemoglobin
MSLDEQEERVEFTPYQAAGELAGITKLVDKFYLNMDTLPEAKTIRSMHPADLAESRKKLTYFLCGWLGGPRLFQEHYGPISIPGAHKRFPIGYEERDAWLLCMQRAIAVQPYSDLFKDYLLAALSIPAERVRQVNAGEV